MTDKKIDLPYIMVVLIAVGITWIVHEVAHWAMSEALGYETAMTLNGTSTVGAFKPTDWHRIIISAAGPLITILQGALFFLLLKFRGWNKRLYAFLFGAFYMRLLAGLMNVVNLNDEGRISEYLNLGAFTLPVLVSAVLFFMVYFISVKYKPGWRFQLWTTLLVMVFSSVLILCDQFFSIRML